jgi:hypothetical protein
VKGLLNRLLQFIQRAQKDPEYKHCLDTIFDLADKWVNKSLDTVDQVSNKLHETSLDGTVSDPTGRLSIALRHLNTLFERLAGGKSTQQMVDHFRKAGEDIRCNSEAREIFSETIRFARKSLQDTNFVQSEEFDRQKSDISQRWRSIVNAETPESRQLKSDIENLRDEVEEFQAALARDPSSKRLRVAFDKFGRDVAKVPTKDTVVAEANIPWIWKDILNVYLPLALEYVKDIPIPR